VSVLEVLANAQCDLIASDGVGATPLHRAAAQGRLGVIDFLMERFSPTATLSKEAWRALNAKDKGGRTALLVACEAGQDEAAIRLARHGADIEVRDADKHGIEELAPKLVSMLRQIAAER
jgi:ankyrin repeat protein